ncbi:MAG: DUF523 and DUF1722 domain-containing protein [Magnetococcales bacterium]|nr:DUF523 and DUF1722 domain-containing protein [Magnetococcales bacterium]
MTGEAYAPALRPTTASETAETTPITLAVSQCLLGDEVRFDGGHKHDSYITGTLGPLFRFIPLCPEVEANFGIPREAMRLEGDLQAPRLISQRTRRDLTPMLAEANARILARLADSELHGCILKKNSPSCGMERVKVHAASGMPDNKGVGLFARSLRDSMPLLPIEEEGRLHDPALRENFIERVFVYHRWLTLLKHPSADKLIAFHTRHKFLLMAHSPEHMRRLGRLVGSLHKDQPIPYAAYGVLLMEAMNRLATTKKHRDVIMHLLGFCKNQLSKEEKEEMQELLAAFSQGHLPLIVPITLLNHYVRKFHPPYLAGQWYLHPHPAELRLRNHV